MAVMTTFFVCGWNCRPEAVLWTSNKTADQRQVYGQFSVYRAIFSTFFTKLLTMAVIWTLFGVVTNLTCRHVVKTADRGSSMDTFRSSSANCRPKAVLWTLFGPLKSCQQNCWPWQFYGHFSVLQESVHKTADLCSSMDTSILKIACSQNCWPWQFYGQIFHLTSFRLFQCTRVS